MRAIQVTRLDGPRHVEVAEVPPPSAAPDDLLIDVRAAGVAFPDVLLTRGLYQMKPDLPFTPGVEVAGTVATAPDDSGFAPGDRVMAFTTLGGFAEQAVAPPETTFPLPERLSFEAGAGLLMNYHTAHFALHRRGRLSTGETVLVHGAAGGVGTATIQIAKGAHARVLAVVSTDAKAAIAERAGADEVLRSDTDWKQAALDATDGRGVDVVMDPVGGDRFLDSIRALAPEGRLLVVGFTSGAIPEVRVNRLLLRNVDLVGVAWGAFLAVDPGLGRDIDAALQPLIAAGTVDPVLGTTYPLEQAAAALADIEERRAVGKVVLTL